MAVPRKHLGAGVLDGCLYAVGGRNQVTELSSVERYVVRLWRAQCPGFSQVLHTAW